MYVDERLTTEQIATRLGRAGTTIRRRLREFRIPTRARGPIVRRRELSTPTVWTSQLGYVVGLIATDGNLSRDGRHLTIPSIDRSLLESVRTCLGLTNTICRQWKNGRHLIYRLQWGDRSFYDWLRSIGLTPAKSRTLPALSVPDNCFADFLRGCIDGDGAILRYTDRYHARKNALYVYDRLYVNLVSASPAFLEWIQATVTRLIGVRGVINVNRKSAHGLLYALRYAKRESIRVLRWIYYAPDVPCLTRKRAKALPFLLA
ncbi:MAG TPA: hypothetical protein VJ755_13200 [Gemmatimonadales bacterium]|nr:hypothetical protein [Gemmatimonadales bacterium]